jgi:hypothetical protein
MNDTKISSAFKTVLSVDQRLETVKYALHEALEDESDLTEQHAGNEHNSFVLGWVKSFNIIMISITLSKESEHSTRISIETANPGFDNKSRQLVHDGFHDFLSFLQHKILPGNIRKNIGDESDYKGVWAWLFFILFAIFMSWYFFDH